MQTLSRKDAFTYLTPAAHASGDVIEACSVAMQTLLALAAQLSALKILMPLGALSLSASRITFGRTRGEGYNTREWAASLGEAAWDLTRRGRSTNRIPGGARAGCVEHGTTGC